MRKIDKDQTLREINGLIALTGAWRNSHLHFGRKIEAAACAIRTQALIDASAAVFMAPEIEDERGR